MRPHEVPQEWAEAGAKELWRGSLMQLPITDQEVADAWDVMGESVKKSLCDGSSRVLAALIPTIRAAALKDHAADAYKVDRTNPDAVQSWLLRAARQEGEK